MRANAWMDSRVLQEYLRELLGPQSEGPSVLLLDNLDAHVSRESEATVAGKLYSTLHPLPPNSTAVCQPLDVSVMGPLKKRLEVAWLEKESESKMTSKKTRLQMIRRTISVWEGISENTMQSAFSKAIACAYV